MRRSPTWLLPAFALAAVSGCGSKPPQNRAPAELQIEYTVEQRTPPAHFQLRVPAHGTAQLVLYRAPSANPTGAAGYFAVRPKPEERTAVERQIDGHSLFSRHDEPDLSEGIGGMLKLTRGTREAEISMGARDESARGLRLLLDGLVSRAAERPLAALALVAHARKDDGRARFEITLVHRGIHPLDVAVSPEREPGATMSLRLMLERGGKLVNELTASPDDVRRLFRDPVRRVEPKTSWRLPPLVMPLPPSEDNLFARVEAKLRIKTQGHPAVDIELTSPSVSLGDEEEQ